MFKERATSISDAGDENVTASLKHAYCGSSDRYVNGSN